jgi:hypothetical protein
VGRREVTVNGTNNLIREYVRKRLLEVCKLPDELYTSVNQAVAGSNFWMEENKDEDSSYASVPHAGDYNQTPAAEALQKALQAAVDAIDYKVIFAVQSADASSDPAMVIDPDHREYPDGVVVGGYAEITKNGRKAVIINMGLFTDEFDPSEFNPGRASRKIGGILRHELVHFVQCERRAEDAGISRKQAFKDFQADHSAIPNSDVEKYWDIWEPTGEIDPETKKEIVNKEGFDSELYHQDYVSSYIEVDAHAHQAADELLSLMGKDKAIEAISQRTEWKELGLDLPQPIEEYLIINKDGKLDAKFRKRVVKYIESLSEQGVYAESRIRHFVRKVLRESHNGLHDDLEIMQSSIHGVGVFVVQDIPAHTNLGAAQIKKDAGYRITDLGRNHNHSYKPTCYNEMEGDTRYLLPHQDMKPGDEVTIDYTLQADLEQPSIGWE